MPEGAYSGELQDNKKGNAIPIAICVCVCVLVIIIWGLVPFGFAQIGYGIFFAKNPNMIWEYTFTEPPLTPKTIPEWIWWPGCEKIGTKKPEYFQKCSKPCFSPDLIPAVADFNGKHEWKKVSYMSRKDDQGKTYKLTGWLLKADRSNLAAGAKAPRVVIQHGFTSNSNKWYPTLSSYYMRSMGFDVLLNNVRGVGYSENATEGITSWGYAYHYDLLGAWDYLKKDPTNFLGGPQPSAKVGIMGFSMGAFITINAFTLDKNVPAAWADSPPARPQSAFGYGASSTPIPGVGLPAGILLGIPGVFPLTWHWCSSKTGIDVEHRTPLKDISKADGSKRPIKLAMNLKDKTVPAADVKAIYEELKKYPEKYETQEPLYTDAMCNNQHHLVEMLLEPFLYRKSLCDFWTQALGVPKSTCGLEKLPKFEGDFKVADTRRLAAKEAFESMSVAV